MKETIEKAGLEITEVARLFHISRSTVYAWINGTPPQNKFVYAEAERTLEKIKAAVEARKLPLFGIVRSERMGVLKKILAANEES